MGYETNPVNIKKMIPSAARPGNSCLHTNPLNSTSSLSPNLCLLCVVWPLCLGKQGDDVGHALPWAPGRNNSICSVPIPKQASPRSDYLISCRGEKIQFSASEPNNALLLTNPPILHLQKVPSKRSSSGKIDLASSDQKKSCFLPSQLPLQFISIAPFVWVLPCFLFI